MYTVVAGRAGAKEDGERDVKSEVRVKRGRVDDEERGSEVEVEKEWRSVYGVDRLFFHIDLRDAVEAAVRGAKAAERRESHGCVSAS